ncbi:ABC transporter substrate-binding protein [Calidifontibacter indicus]|uniref:Putative spermidine/putrescine transport system substrate-binding protein n=1 Tax=Calidifontibacter indicus TaxID=419650 RepID=A0A3D9UKL5_9MICO|nr:ABC transporter substrate-binding protein [Calidifontibacter indicus]REF30008.1 putative spermidine/putrescine transport system substrate-binding protein [Calidifontibacter indicus]
MSTVRTRLTALVVAGFTAATVAACSAPTDSSSSSSSTNSSGGSAGAAVDAKTATSAKDFGSMDKLVEAAKKEGALNVIALPPDWANYKEILDGFKAKYPQIKITSAQPDASSADEIAAAKRLKGQGTAPDVFDLGSAVALTNTAMFAPYKVESFDKIPAENKEATGLWVNDYAGMMTVGYDSAKVPAPTSLADLLKPEYKGKVALNGDPTKAGSAFGAVQMVAINEGGTVDDPTKAIDYFKKLKAAGNFLPVDPTPATIESGQTPVVFDWSYNQTAIPAKVKTWKLWAPPKALKTYYNQAINKDAPHPAAARLFQEYLFSAAGQNAWLKGGATPVLMDAMTADGTIDKAAAAALPKAGEVTVPTPDETDKAKSKLATAWPAAMG